MHIQPNQTVGEIVAKDYRTASVFKAHGIDFCCKGGRTLTEACVEKQIDIEQLIAELEQVGAAGGAAAPDFEHWPMDLLVDYIEKKHHRYVEARLPEILQHLDKLCKVHGERHPELFEIKEEFSKAAGELAAHMKKEELILFPYVRKLAVEAHPAPPMFGTVQNPIAAMVHEHAVEGERFERIAQLTNQYTPPADGCTTYRVAFALLKEFEDDLHMHIHLENNILFPKAIERETQMSATS